MRVRRQTKRLPASPAKLAQVFQDEQYNNHLLSYSKFVEGARGARGRENEVKILYTPMEPSDFVLFYQSITRSGFVDEAADAIFVDALKAERESKDFIQKVAESKAEPLGTGSQTFFDLVAHESARFPKLLEILMPFGSGTMPPISPVHQEAVPKDDTNVDKPGKTGDKRRKTVVKRLQSAYKRLPSVLRGKPAVTQASKFNALQISKSSSPQATKA